MSNSNFLKIYLIDLISVYDRQVVSNLVSVLVKKTRCISFLCTQNTCRRKLPDFVYIVSITWVGVRVPGPLLLQPDCGDNLPPDQ